MKHQPRPMQIAVLGSAETGSAAHALAGAAGELIAELGMTLVSGCGSAATRHAAERAIAAGGRVLSILPGAEHPDGDWPATVVLPSGLGAGRNLLMALAGEACVVIGGRAGTRSEVCLAWLHGRPLLPLVGQGGWSETLLDQPPDERGSAPLIPWRTVPELRDALLHLSGMRITSDSDRDRAVQGGGPPA
ncbi:MAG: Rossmann fold nucleotide-binding protein [Xanthomonadales bacterium]|nr:Rossmann fold nucleotide-binding protein [Xanthomonadales bacterium]MCB1629486.1 Rossmann fold nucleotide-binding protein [Xanthomonadales bacterium]